MSESQMGTMLESRDREPLSHSLEDYLEAIVDLAGGPNEPIRAVDVATKLNVSKASVSKAVTNLKEKGYAVQPYYGDITLTEEGYEYGSTIWRRHNLLLASTLKLPIMRPAKLNTVSPLNRSRSGKSI